MLGNFMTFNSGKSQALNIDFGSDNINSGKSQALNIDFGSDNITRSRCTYAA